MGEKSYGGGMKPRLSFVIPVYKPDMAVFEKCLRSIKDQALKEWEAIVVFDGELPNGNNTVSKVFGKAKNYRTVTIEHGGACKARNAGAALVSGDIICFWDADCVIEPGASKMWIEQFDKRTEVAFIYSGYKFFGGNHAIASNDWDPYLLRVRNFISTCFPVRRHLAPKWCESLESLQDWDFWLGVLKNATDAGLDQFRAGLFVPGYAFSTAYPTPESISGKGCKPEVWLERMRAVKSRHGIADNRVCVVAPDHRPDGIKLAKLIGADYQDAPNDKPNTYDTIIKVGFSTSPSRVERDSSAFKKEARNFLFWTSENINELYHATTVSAMLAYRELLNRTCVQFVEDKTGERLMSEIGFQVKVMHLPIVHSGDIPPMPQKPRWIVDVSDGYGLAMAVLERSLPDMELCVLNDMERIGDFTGIIHFFPDKSMTNTIKRAALTGRYVISNVQAPFCGYIDDTQSPEKFVVDMVSHIRGLSLNIPNKIASEYYRKTMGSEKFKELINAAS